jgi:uroporphyrinogen-III decarboxylase
MVAYDRFEPYIGEPDKQRLIDALKKKPVDRVPNWEVLIEDKHIERILGRYAGNSLAYGGDPAKGAGHKAERPMYPDDYIDLCEIIGQDMMTFEAGFWTPFKRKDAQGNSVDVYDRSVKSRSDFESLFIDTQSQIDYAVKYIHEYRNAIKRRNSKIGITCGYGCIFQTLYEFLIGFEDCMVMCLENQTLIEDMLEVSTNHFIKLTEAIIGAGVDILYPADDVAFKSGLFVRPSVFREMWVPRMRRIMEPAARAGTPIIFHSDGKIDDIAHDLIEMGVDGVFAMDPYCIDYRDYKKRYGKNLTLIGNIDITFPLATGKPEDVEKDVVEHMGEMKPGYGYIAASSHSIVNYIPHENFVTMINAIHEYGKY